MSNFMLQLCRRAPKKCTTCVMNDSISIEVKKLLSQDQLGVAIAILEGISLRNLIEQALMYERCSDLPNLGRVSVIFDHEDNAFVGVSTKADDRVDREDMVKFHCYAKNGQSLHVHKALIILALAIIIDNKEFPQEDRY